MSQVIANELKTSIKMPEIAPGPMIWSYLVKARDNFTCQECNLTKEDIDIESHHINQLENPLLVSNGITLCYKCHARAHNARPRPIRQTVNLEGISPKIPEVVAEAQSVEITISFRNIAKLLNVPISSLREFLISERVEQWQEARRNLSYGTLFKWITYSKKEFSLLQVSARMRERIERRRN